MKKTLLIFIGLLPLLSIAQDWEPLGPDTLNVNSFFVDEYTGTEFLCTNQGLAMKTSATNWELFNEFDIEIIDAASLNDTSILVVSEGNSACDGVHLFSLNNYQFHFLKWISYPNFIHFKDNQYFIGSEDRLYYSPNGTNWNQYYEFGKVMDVAIDGDNWLAFVSDDGTYINSTDDGGVTWVYGSQVSSLPVVDIEYDGSVYMILGGNEDSSGIYVSHDFSQSFTALDNTVDMSSILLRYDHIFGSWYYSDADEKGVNVWNNETQEFISLNSGLPNLNVNKIVNNPLIDTYNLVACTEEGAYIAYDDIFSVEETKESTKELFTVDPNPFGENANFTLQDNSLKKPVKIELFDMNGKRIMLLWINSHDHNQQINNKLNNLQKGIYLLNASNKRTNQAMKLIKK
jgi:hypothetical protein